MGLGNRERNKQEEHQLYFLVIKDLHVCTGSEHMSHWVNWVSAMAKAPFDLPAASQFCS